MAKQVQKKKGQAVVTVDPKAQAKTVDGEQIKEDIDELLDEIDSVLEENAEEFVKNFVQRGGQ